MKRCTAVLVAPKPSLQRSFGPSRRLSHGFAATTGFSGYAIQTPRHRLSICKLFLDYALRPTGSTGHHHLAHAKFLNSPEASATGFGCLEGEFCAVDPQPVVSVSPHLSVLEGTAGRGRGARQQGLEPAHHLNSLLATAEPAPPTLLPWERRLRSSRAENCCHRRDTSDGNIVTGP